jgi:hypothetical protein
MSGITLVLESVGPGESQATEELFTLVYEELRRLAGEAAGQTLQPTALVHEAWLQLVGSGDWTWENRGHFLGRRRILIDNARRKSALKHGGGQERVPLENLEVQLQEAVCVAALNITDATLRAQFLDRACVGDLRLRAAVEAMLLDDAEADNYFQK